MSDVLSFGAAVNEAMAAFHDKMREQGWQPSPAWGVNIHSYKLTDNTRRGLRYDKRATAKGCRTDARMLWVGPEGSHL